MKRGKRGRVWLTDEFENVGYSPSYEPVLRMDVCAEDGRHVSQEAIDFIVGNFLRGNGRP